MRPLLLANSIVGVLGAPVKELFVGLPTLGTIELGTFPEGGYKYLWLNYGIFYPVAAGVSSVPASRLFNFSVTIGDFWMSRNTGSDWEPLPAPSHTISAAGPDLRQTTEPINFFADLITFQDALPNQGLMLYYRVDGDVPVGYTVTMSYKLTTALDSDRYDDSFIYTGAQAIRTCG